MTPHLRAILNSYAEVFFLQGAGLGSVMFAVLLLHPGSAALGVIAVLAAYAFARFIGLGEDFLQTGYYTYNPLLVGLSLGYIFEFGPLTAMMVICCGILTLVVTVMLASLFTRYLGVPILSVPFVLVSSIVYLASLRYSNLLVAAHHVTPDPLEPLLPFWLWGFLRCFGAILFTPSATVGLVAAALVLMRSRLLFALALMGYLSGTTIRGTMIGSYTQAFGDMYGFNFIVIAMALGGVFLIPSPASFAIAFVGVACSTILLDASTVFWSYYGIPAFTLPFNMVSIAALYVLGVLGSPLIARNVRATPEETLDLHLTVRRRHRGTERTLILPFAGQWLAWQGFDGPWTHKGSWRYGYDFLIEGEDKRTFRGEGTRLEDYHAFRKPVLSPVRGRVVRVSDDRPDNAPGQVDGAAGWGNAIVIRDDRGFFVEISHLAHKSAAVKQGDWVERSARIGLCGNSGLSPQPHIHVQAQLSDALGSATLPFSFVSYTDGARYHANDVPPAGTVVEPLFLDQRLETATTFLLDEEHHFVFEQPGKKPEPLSLKVKMAVDGTFYLDSGRARLYFGKHEGTFYVHSLDGDDERLALIFLALPRLPLAYREGMTWEDDVPLALCRPGPRRMAARFLRAFLPDLARVIVTQRFVERGLIEADIRSDFLREHRTAQVELDDRNGFGSIRCEGFLLRRVRHEAQ